MDYAAAAFEKELRKLVKERKSKLEIEVSSGRATSFEDYRRRCGGIAALGDVLEDIGVVRRKIMGDDALETP